MSKLTTMWPTIHQALLSLFPRASIAASKSSRTRSHDGTFAVTTCGGICFKIFMHDDLGYVDDETCRRQPDARPPTEELTDPVT